MARANNTSPRRYNMREKETSFYDQKLIKGNYFPYYERRFQNWIDEQGEYDKLKILISIECDESERTIAIDVGANVGLTTRILAEHYDYVIAIEPSSQNRACLYRNMKEAMNNVIALPFAAGKENRKSELRINMDNCGGSAINKEFCNSDTVEGIEIRRIDDMVNSIADKEKTSLIKLDIQGGEYEALIGAENTIKRSRPTIICEVKSFSKETDPNIANLMRDMDYVEFVRYGKDTVYIAREKCTQSKIDKVKKITSNSKTNFRLKSR